jgi:hypothetical protein
MYASMLGRTALSHGGEMLLLPQLFADAEYAPIPVDISAGGRAVVGHSMARDISRNVPTQMAVLMPSPRSRPGERRVVGLGAATIDRLVGLGDKGRRHQGVAIAGSGVNVTVPINDKEMRPGEP